MRRSVRQHTQDPIHARNFLHLRVLHWFGGVQTLRMSASTLKVGRQFPAEIEMCCLQPKGNFHAHVQIPHRFVALTRMKKPAQRSGWHGRVPNHNGREAAPV